jgi:hypothetical protein
MARKRRKKRKGTQVPVKGHTRSPRGPDKGKPRPRVKGHTRGKPKKRR